MVRQHHSKVQHDIILTTITGNQPQSLLLILCLFHLRFWLRLWTSIFAQLYKPLELVHNEARVSNSTPKLVLVHNEARAIPILTPLLHRQASCLQWLSSANLHTASSLGFQLLHRVEHQELQEEVR